MVDNAPSLAKIFVTQIQTRDMFVVANPYPGSMPLLIQSYREYLIRRLIEVVKYSKKIVNMALSLDDRLLGEKTDYYCSSSDEEDEDITHKQADLSAVVHDADSSQYTGHCTNVSTFQQQKNGVLLGVILKSASGI